MSGPDPPYRDDRPALHAEIARLRAELARARRRRPYGMLFVAIVAHVAARQLSAPWLNGSSDARFWAGVAFSAAPLIFAAYALVRARYPEREESS